MRLCDRTSDRQAHTHSPRLGSEKRFEDCRHRYRVNAFARITNRYLYLIFIDAHADGDFTEVLSLRNSIESIKNQIENHLLELDSISGHSRPGSRNFKSQRYVSQ